MKIFGWMQSKLIDGRQATKKPNPIPPTHQPAAKEEFSDWPNALLAIGTFGNGNKSEPSSSQDQPDQESTPEDQVELQGDDTRPDASIPASDPCRNCSKGEVGEEDDRCFCDGSSSQEDETSVIKIAAGRHVLGDHLTNNKKINKKSLSFLLKKMFVCSSGFAPSPSSIRDRYQVPESRMEKMLRAILNKKIHPQSQSSIHNTKKYLQDNRQHRFVITEDDMDDDDDEEEAEVGTKWVKTDSEYIVLEI